MKTICFDLDGVICNTKKNYYRKSKPIEKNIEFVNHLYKKGFKILIYTSRFMGRNKDNAKKAHDQGYKFTKLQLRSWGVKYSKLIMGKPSYDVFIDDKSLFFRKNWANKKYF